MFVRVMMTLVGVCCLAVLGVSAGQDGKGDATQTDEEKLVGDWDVVSAVKKGQKAPDDALSNMKVTFAKAGKLTFSDGTKTMEVTYKMDASKSPKEIDVTEQDNLHKGIYAFDGDKLKICVAHPPLDRPTE